LSASISIDGKVKLEEKGKIITDEEDDKV